MILFTNPSKLFLIIISIQISPFILITTHSSHTQCLHHQKTLLLQLKSELIFNSSLSTKLVRWSRDTDEWHGVECDAVGHVTGLHLDHESISGGLGDSSSLFALKHLEKLNLAHNFFYTPIPKGIRNLTYLTHLNLSFAAFGGQVPAQISSLRRLVSLDISTDDKTLTLEHPNLQILVETLTGLRELYLDGVNITSSHERRKWSHIISSYLPNLTTLSLRNCGLSSPLANSFWQLHSLSILRLDGNDLSTTLPNLFAKFSSLTTLTLSYCNLKGSSNMIFHIPTLEILDLSSNENLSGSIPPFTHQNGSLKTLVLSCTNFSGFIPSSISNLRSLSVLDLSSCKFSGAIPSTFANLTELSHVDLSYNFFTGSLSSFHGLTNLVTLDLSCNHLEGTIPHSFFQLRSSLKYLLLSKNSLDGNFQLDEIQRLPNLTELDLSGNKVSVDVQNDVVSSVHGFHLQLRVLRLPSCNMNEFPDLLKHCDHMIELDLSNNTIGGEIPSWIWGRHLRRLDLSFNLLTALQEPYLIPTSLQSIILHSNQLGGELRLPFPPNTGNELSTLSLASNNFSGSIPTSLCIATYLRTLDLSDNKFSGGIPSCLLQNTTILRVIGLGRNGITGRIPDKFSPHCSLEFLDVSDNALEGEIPKSLESCKALVVLNVGGNGIHGAFPCMLPSSLRVLVLHSNRFHGEATCHDNGGNWPDLQILDASSNSFGGSLESINFSSWRKMALHDDDGGKKMSYYYYLQSFGVKLILKGLEVKFAKIWEEFNAIDFSCNNFHGEIPDEVGLLSSLHALNFSHNALNGRIPKSFGQLRKLESLDLSGNQLSGTVPGELAGLNFLEVLNLSCNELVGEIPKGRQFQTFSADSFEGNSKLCGFPLSISCGGSDGVDLSNVEEEGEIKWEYVSAALGYAVGLGSIVCVLVFCRGFREKYFDKVDEVFEEIFKGRRKRRRRARREVQRQ